ncbi:MAG: ATP-binding protein, partial [Ruminococcus sp.]|nr:ATP-binding protein [Ruminococcus sp.]
VEGTNEEPGRKFIFIIDEWDAVIREAKDDPNTQKQYLDLLREWFKNISFTPKVVAAAYMTGILPIKKDGSQSAISDFKEFTMIKPRQFGGFVGFTEDEVQAKCTEHDMNFDTMKQWYDGYYFKNVGSVYNPNSVMQAIENDDFDSYWTETSAAEGLMEYISQDYNGLTKTIAELIAGIEVQVNTKGFANDLTTFKSKDDVLTLLIHLGYLAYDSEKKTVHIPNEEIRQEFQKSIREVKHDDTLKRLKESDQLFNDTIHANEKAVAAQIEKIHMEETAPLHYNKEDSLRSVIKLAYYTYRDYYVQWEELPAGVGYADVVYLPKYDSDYPILVIELKWNQEVETAIDQIKNRHYPESFKGYGRDILLVGITYDKEAPAGKRKHICKIEKVIKD